MGTVLVFLVECSIRSLIIALAVAGALLALKVKSPAILHRAWTAVLLSVLLLPMLPTCGLRIDVPVLPPLPESTFTLSESQASPAPSWRPEPFQASQLAGAVHSAAPVMSPHGMTNAAPSWHRPGPVAIAIFLYAAGLCVLAARLLLGTALAFLLSREAAKDGRVLRSAFCRVPLTVGLFRPRVLLPLESQGWPQEKLDAVLMHEREHVRRRDPLVEWLAMVNRCIYWFNPLAWWLCRRLAALAEQACDEAVLVRGYEPAKYAELLLDLARSVKKNGAMVEVWGSPIDGSTLAVRIRRILTAGRSPSLSRSRFAGLSALCACAITVPALVTPARTPTRVPIQSSAVESAHPEVVEQAGRKNLLQAKPAPDMLSTPSDRSHTATGMDSQRLPQFANESPAVLTSAQNPPDVTSPRTVDSQMKIISINMRDMQTLGSARTPAERAEAEIQKFLLLYPRSDYVPMVTEWLAQVENSLERQRLESLPENYRKWLQEDVVYIISKEEKDAFLSLRTDDEREKFIEQFWARRNPDPTAVNNPAKAEHYRRLAYGNGHFACGIPGWKTDRGRIYILYGEPDRKEARMPSGSGGYPRENWFYDHLAGGGPAGFTFLDRNLDGCFPLIRPPAAKTEAPPLRAGSLMLVPEIQSVPPIYERGVLRLGEREYVPNYTTEYSNNRNLTAILQISNAGVDQATNKPNLQISFIIKAGNRTVSDIEDTSGRTCFLNGDRVMIVGSVPLNNLDPGKYSLYVRVYDRTTTLTVETSADFTIRK